MKKVVNIEMHLVNLAKLTQGDAKFEDSGFDLNDSETRKLISFHRVENHILKNLSNSSRSSLNEGFATLKRAVMNNTAKTLMQFYSLQQLSQKFDLEGVHFMVIKGIALSQMLYGDYSFRSSRDIDILVKYSDVSKADSLLRQLGYVRSAPSENTNTKQWHIYLQNYNHGKYHHPNGAFVELHWRMHKYRIHPNTFEDFYDNSIVVDISGITVRTLSEEGYLSYLCNHGAGHSWAALYWLIDVVRILEKIKEEDLFAALEKAKKGGTSAAFLSGLYLAGKIFNYNCSPQIQSIYNGCKPARKLVANSVAVLNSSPHNKMTAALQLKIIKTLLLLKEGFSHKLQVVFYLITSFQDWQLLPLPSWLFWLYVPLRPFLWGYRKLFKR